MSALKDQKTDSGQLNFKLSPDQIKVFEEVGARITELFSGYAEEFEKVGQAFRTTIADAAFDLPSPEEQDKNYRARLKMLADNGWFAGMDFPLVTLNRLDALFREGRVGDADKALTAYFDKEAESIVKGVSHQYPETGPLLERALRAYHHADYAVAVLILFSQADGLWFRQAQHSPYSRSPSSQKKLRNAIDGQKRDSVIRAYWELLLEDIPLTRSYQKGQPIPEPLNRHAVMHGHSVKFGTKVNCARAFSWLSYISEIRGFFGLYREGARQHNETDKA